jgi:hypothetical protein
MSHSVSKDINPCHQIKGKGFNWAHSLITRQHGEWPSCVTLSKLLDLSGLRRFICRMGECQCLLKWFMLDDLRDWVRLTVTASDGLFGDKHLSLSLSLSLSVVQDIAMLPKLALNS